MPKLPDLVSGFNMLREIDLNAIRNQAEEPFHVAVMGEDGAGKSTIIKQLLTGPGSNVPAVVRPVSEHRLNEELIIQPSTLVILVLNASQPEPQVPEKLRSLHVPIIVCYNKVDLVRETQALSNELLRWPGKKVVMISATDRTSVLKQLVPAVMQIYKGREIILARHLPIFREPVSRKLIEDTCFVNAAYSLTSGIASLSILLAIPLNLTDMVILTKNQALMAYKIALAFDLPSDWTQTIPKLSAVVGAGFIWRTVARQVVGLVPVVGVIPKVAVAYAGTYAVGQAIYLWCANNEKVSPQTLRNLYSQALDRGRNVASTLISGRRKLLPQ